MEDKEFFDKALGLAKPWFVRSVRLDEVAAETERTVGQFFRFA